MELIDLTRQIGAQQPPLYPRFVADWRGMCEASPALDDAVTDSILEACAGVSRSGESALTDSAGDPLPLSGYCDAGMSVLMESAGCSKRRLTDTIRSLSQAGLLSVRRRRNASSVLSLTIPGVGDYAEWRKTHSVPDRLAAVRRFAAAAR